MKNIHRIVLMVSAVIIPLYVFAAEPSLLDNARRAAAEAAAQKAAAIAEGQRLDDRIAELKATQAVKKMTPETRAFAQNLGIARVRVKVDTGVNVGTATVIKSQDGVTTLLTVGHIFRNSGDKPIIEVDIYNPKTGKVEKVVGKIVKYDLAEDLGVFTFESRYVFPVISIAPLNERQVVNQRVMSYGCSDGECPTVLNQKITRLNRYLGSDNIECTGVPTQGRSGGPLMDTQGRVIGVCQAADQHDQRGVYSGTKPIHEFLKRAGIVMPPYKLKR